MKLQELLMKNKLFYEKQKMLKQKPEKAEVVEETPHKITIEQKEDVEGQKEDYISITDVDAEKPAPKKKSGKKPANRAYMVVENIDEVNK